MQFKVNDSVKVKKGVRCPDRETLDIGNWQGRIIEANEGEDVVNIQWDSLTLEQMPLDYIQASEEEGLGWTEMCLSVDELEPASPRDSAKKARQVREQMESKFGWLGMGKEGQRVFMVVANADPGEEFTVWEIYLGRTLVFPFDAKVSEPPDHGPLKYGDAVQVTSLADTDDRYGILVHILHDGKDLVFPLCDLTPVDKKSPNYTPVQDYSFWYTNR